MHVNKSGNFKLTLIGILLVFKIIYKRKLSYLKLKSKT